MPKTKDAFAFRDFDGERILQRKFFRQLNLPCGTDNEILNRYRQRWAVRDLSAKECGEQAAELRKICSKTFQYLEKISAHCTKLEKLKNKCADVVAKTSGEKGLKTIRRIYYLRESYGDFSTAIFNLCGILSEFEESFSNRYNALCRAEFGNRLRETRRSKNLTQAQLADLVGGVSRNAIQKYESGVADISLPNLCKVTKILGVSADSLLGLK